MLKHNTFHVGEREYGFLSPYMIAEIGVNHEGDLDRAKRMIDAVADAGGHAAKFQTYKAETLAAEASSPAYWDRKAEPTGSQFELFKKFDAFGPDEYRALADHCRSRGVDFLSTPFDLEAVDLLAPLAPAMKIASADITNIPLLRKVGATALPVILSVGAAQPFEMARAVQELQSAGAKHVALLHCVLNYPTPPDQAQLAQIDELQRNFGSACPIGYSDHVTPEVSGAMPALEAAVLRGAVVIEKHFTDDKTASGNDHYHAMNGSDLERFMERLATYRTLMGGGLLNLGGQTAAIENARRRVIAAREIDQGAVLGPGDLVALRSNTGIEISHWDDVVGRTARTALQKGAALTWGDLE